MDAENVMKKEDEGFKTVDIKSEVPLAGPVQMGGGWRDPRLFK